MKKALIGFGLISSLLLSGCWVKGSGEKIGQLTKISQEGLFCTTWEGEIQRGGLNGGSGVNGQSFPFTVENNPDLVNLLQKYMKEQREIKITYRSEVGTFCRSDSDNHFVTGVELIDNIKPVTVTTAPENPIQIQQVSVDDKQAKMMQLLKIQNELINELTKSQ